MTDLTPKQENFIEAYIDNGGNGTAAALEAYNTTDTNTAAVIASENLRKPKIVSALEEALPDHLLAQVHKEGLMATRPIYDKEGKLVGEDADFNARHKYLDSAYKIKGLYAPEKKLNVNLTISEVLDSLENGPNGQPPQR